MDPEDSGSYLVTARNVMKTNERTLAIREAGLAGTDGVATLQLEKVVLSVRLGVIVMHRTADPSPDSSRKVNNFETCYNVVFDAPRPPCSLPGTPHSNTCMPQDV